MFEDTRGFLYNIGAYLFRKMGLKHTLAEAS